MGEPPSPRDGITRLTAVTPDDTDAIEAGIHDPDVVRWIGPPPASVDDLAELDRRRLAAGSPTFAIRDDDDRFLGLVWLNRSASEPGSGEVGYWLLPAARGQGHATRAVRLLVEGAIRVLGLRRIELVADVRNAASRRVAERAGFRHVATRPGPVGAAEPTREDAVHEFPIGEG